MSLESHFCLLAEYNQWMNLKVYESAGRLSQEDLTADGGAFFRSVLGTLNHIVVADIIWLKRFATHPSCESLLRDIVDLPNPASLDHIVYDDFEALSELRYWLDDQIIKWTGALTADDLNFVLSYRNTKGIAANKRFASLLLHFFNHQTHHRGQVSTLLSQAGEDVGVTDLLALIKEEI